MQQATHPTFTTTVSLFIDKYKTAGVLTCGMTAADIQMNVFLFKTCYNYNLYIK